MIVFHQVLGIENNGRSQKNTAVDLSLVDDIPKILAVLPLRDNVIFPYMIFPVLVGREHSIRAANHALENSKYIFLAPQKKAITPIIAVAIRKISSLILK